MRRGLILMTLIAFVSGCSLMPYKSEFQCSDVDKGKCMAVEDAYMESFKDKKNKKTSSKKNDKKGQKETEERHDSVYKKNLEKKLSRLLKEPVTPVVVPPKTVRVLILPYNNRDKLFMPRYIYIMVDEPSWVMGEYLLKEK